MNTFASLRRPSVLIHLGALLLLASLLQGCGYLARRAADEDPLIDATGKDVVITATLPKSVYRPGEAVVATVTLRNTTKNSLNVRVLAAESGPPATAAGSVTFWFGPVRNLDRFQRYPVVSKREAASRGPEGGAMVQLSAGETIARQFLLTRITEKPGDYVFQARVEPFRTTSVKRIGKFYSEPVRYEVYGPRLFQRDSKGLLELEEAIRVAAAAAPGDVHLMDAVLIEDEMGFHKWWVNVDYESPSKGYIQAAYLVDPYLGRVWSDAKQFESSLKSDARRIRYDELRRMRERARANNPDVVFDP